MDLIEYANKFTELEFLIRAVYSATEKGIYIKDWGLMWYDIYTDIPNWFEWSLYIIKPTENSKGGVPDVFDTLKVIGDKKIQFGFWVDSDNKTYFVHGFDH